MLGNFFFHKSAEVTRITDAGLRVNSHTLAIGFQGCLDLFTQNCQDCAQNSTNHRGHPCIAQRLRAEG